VVAAGSYSGLLLRQLDIRLPVRPAKGYSVTLNCTGNSRSLSIPIIDDQLHAAVVPLADTIRVAGTAEFAGYDVSLRAGRVRNLTALIKTLLPQFQFDPTSTRPWCGLRPMSADGVPIIGCTSIANLWVSTGHGHLGWTMAAGSGQLLTDLMSGDSPAIDAKPYALTRFA
jgi:D-amino-acid dehydrogenase